MRKTLKVIPVIAVVGALLVFGLAASAQSKAAPAQAQAEKKTERIAVTELKKRLDSGTKLLLIDVREDVELEQDGAIEGAIHIPVGELDARMKDIPKDVQLVFY